MFIHVMDPGKQNMTLTFKVGGHCHISNAVQSQKFDHRTWILTVHQHYQPWATKYDLDFQGHPHPELY